MSGVEARRGKESQAPQDSVEFLVSLLTRSNKPQGDDDSASLVGIIEQDPQQLQLNGLETPREINRSGRIQTGLVNVELAYRKETLRDETLTSLYSVTIHTPFSPSEIHTLSLEDRAVIGSVGPQRGFEEVVGLLRGALVLQRADGAAA